MNRILLMAWHYVAYHKGKTAILTICLTLTGVLPLTAQLLITQYGQSLTERARCTPLVVGAKGNRFDLVLKALYFNSAGVDQIKMSEVDSIRESGLALAIPLHLNFTARRHPIVGTALEYFEFRGLNVARGTGLRELGQAVLGAEVAAELELDPGDYLFSDQRSLYDITKTYPLKLHVVGVLAETGSPDDQAVFVDIKTAWVIGGQSHGHQNLATSADSSVILRRSDDNVVTSDAIVEYNEVTPENLASFHTHGDPADLPLSAIIVLPYTSKSSTLIKARYNVSATHRILVPEEVVGELLGLVFKIKRFFDANFALITVSTLLFLILVLMLSRRIRRREMETMFKIGCSRMTVFRLQAAELAIVLVMALLLTGGLTITALWAAPHFLRFI